MSESGRKLAEILSIMEEAALSKFAVQLVEHETAMAKYHERAGRFGYRGRGGTSDRISLEAGRVSRHLDERDRVLAYVRAIRSYQPFVDADLMTVAEVMKLQNDTAGHAAMEMALTRHAEISARPHVERLARERNAEINEENDSRERSERISRIEPGVRVKETRNDKIQDRDSDCRKRFP